MLIWLIVDPNPSSVFASLVDATSGTSNCNKFKKPHNA